MRVKNWTKGEWVAEGLEVYSDDCDAHAVAEIPVNHSCRDSVEEQANAQLISAAPEMVEALEDCLRGLLDENPLAYPTEIDAAKRALVKAYGETV